MNKDVIYIDVEDDVTAIIGKIKKAKEKVIALVPPKRTGALQSAVNLRLLERMAKNDKKTLVLITNNQALVALAASAKIPVAKNLQSKPEVAEIPAIIVDDGDDIIDGSTLPVGDHASTIKVKDGTKVTEDTLATATRNETIDATDLDIDGEKVATVATTKSVTRKAKNRPKIPNFDSFRKWLVLGIIGGVGLIALLVWMFVFAPAATVIITASTEPQSVSSKVKLGGVEATNFEKGIVNSVSQKETKDETVEFDATGEKDIGNKAIGTLEIRKLSQDPYGVPAGTKFTASGGRVFVTQSAVTIPAYSVCFPSLCAGSVDVEVQAENAGTGYNGVSGNATGPDGITGSFQGATSGGTSKIATVVSADDIERARGQLVGQSTDEQKNALIQKFTDGAIVIDSSFVVERGKVVSSPKEGEEAKDGKATLTIETTYTIQAVPRAELDSYLKASIGSKIDTETQKIYSTGIENATLSNFQNNEEEGMTATVNAVGAIGPQINEDDIKEQVKGKRYGEVQQSLESQDGIKEVDIQFSYFWVRTVPNNTDKITIEFKVDDE